MGQEDLQGETGSASAERRVWGLWSREGGRQAWALVVGTGRLPDARPDLLGGGIRLNSWGALGPNTECHAGACGLTFYKQRGRTGEF